jgi:manganese-dependent inorganic pyrophosphatase
LLCGILADTLILQSATTAELDIETAEYLSSITALDIRALGHDLQNAANQVNSLPPEELVGMDMKEYTERGFTFTVSQIETDNPAALVERRAEIGAALEQNRAAKDHLFSALLVTDVTALDSLLFVTGKKSFTSQINFPLNTQGIYVLKEVVSRKKQLIPLLAELVEKVS